MKKPNGFWTKERCRKEALKYKSRNDFRKGVGSNWAYRISLKNNWMNDICTHMSVIGNLYKRCIYSFEFADNNVYVGLTYNFDNRVKTHYKDNKSQVYKHIKLTNLTPKIFKLTNYIDVSDAKIKELEFLEKYIENGWTILNKAKTGGIGSKAKITREKCYEILKDYNKLYDFRKEQPNIYKSINLYGWRDLLTFLDRDIKESGFWTKEKCQEVALKYSRRIDFFKKDISAYNKSQINGWLDEVCLHMIKKDTKSKGYWTKDIVIEESTKYKTKEEFKKGSPSAYNYYIKNKLFDIIILEGREKWSKEKCLEIINKCNSPGELKKINNVVYKIYLENKWNIKSEIQWSKINI